MLCVLLHVVRHTNKCKSFPFVYADSIQYESRQEVTLTPQDVEAIQRFVTRYDSKVIEKLVSIFDPSIIGYNHVKQGLLLFSANTGTDIPTKRNRLHAI